ncbi:major allergen Pru ar 1-like [Eucalyptus grandis]|uniref:major allergen Pru ar 1-like n=1 Tax=Eucalyptus grandis TaxID=71139 RepID=UPI00192EDCAC|nr:major allergen Pru ar 1-like [Eucalyptus grandis]
MGVFIFTDVYTSTIPPKRLSKALIVDSQNLIPKLMPQAINNIDIIQGSQLRSMKNRVDELNEETFTYNYTMIDLTEKFESIGYEVKFEPTPDGKSKNKMTSTCYTKGNFKLEEEDIGPEKRTLGMYEVVEAYLLQNPHSCA